MSVEWGILTQNGFVTAYHSREDAERVAATAPDRFVLVRRTGADWEEVE